MKRLVVVFLFLAMFTFAFAEPCSVSVSILNQDPFPAVPGDVVEVVFVLDGIDSDECGTIEFFVQDSYPFTVMPYDESNYRIQSGTFVKDRNSQKLIPVDFLVDENAIDGANPLDTRYTTTASVDAEFTQTFDIEVKDARADFEIFVSDYDYSTQELKFEILNIGKSDIEAVTVEIPTQNSVTIIGANRNNVGDLSSNEDTSADFNADINGESISLIVYYSDSINERRTSEHVVFFNAEQFASTKAQSNNTLTYWVIGIVIIVAFFWFRSRKKKHSKE
ncbi:MAG: hypothetical protein ACI83O_000046 [Patescibacteria group bacterium]|jgi:hypothetical protein